MQAKGASGQAPELRHPDLGPAPEASVDVDGSPDEPVFEAIDPEGAAAGIGQAAAAAFGVDDGVRVHPTAVLQRWF